MFTFTCLQHRCERFTLTRNQQQALWITHRFNSLPRNSLFTRSSSDLQQANNDDLLRRMTAKIDWIHHLKNSHPPQLNSLWNINLGNKTNRWVAPDRFSLVKETPRWAASDCFWCCSKIPATINHSIYPHQPQNSVFLVHSQFFNNFTGPFLLAISSVLYRIHFPLCVRLYREAGFPKSPRFTLQPWQQGELWMPAGWFCCSFCPPSLLDWMVEASNQFSLKIFLNILKRNNTALKRT